MLTELALERNSTIVAIRRDPFGESFDAAPPIDLRRPAEFVFGAAYVADVDSLIARTTLRNLVFDFSAELAR